jgi:hypothetical protein
MMKRVSLVSVPIEISSEHVDDALDELAELLRVYAARGDRNKPILRSAIVTAIADVHAIIHDAETIR